MTLKELSQIYYLNKEISRDKRRLYQLKASKLQASKLSKMPSAAHLIYDTMAEKAATTADLETDLHKTIAKRYREELRLTRYINEIDDCFIRLIFKLRFIDCKTWWQVATEIGGGNTADSVRKCCKRYLKKCPKCPLSLC